MSDFNTYWNDGRSKQKRIIDVMNTNSVLSHCVRTHLSFRCKDEDSVEKNRRGNILLIIKRHCEIKTSQCVSRLLEALMYLWFDRSGSLFWLQGSPSSSRMGSCGRNWRGLSSNYFSQKTSELEDGSHLVMEYIDSSANLTFLRKKSSNLQITVILVNINI